MKKTIAGIIFFTLSLCLTTFSFAFSKADLQALERRANQGNVEAQSELGLRYYRGYGVKEDHAKGFNWSMKAAQQNDASAQFILGDAYLLGMGVKTDLNQALIWYKKSAVQGDSDGMYGAAILLYEKKNYTEAAKWYAQAAALGDMYAQFELGKMYFEGQGLKRDYAKAFNLIVQSANQGYAPAIYVHGMFLERGMQTTENMPAARALYKKACDLGKSENFSPGSQEALSVQQACAAYHLPDSNPNHQDFERLAQQGDAKAQAVLGSRYLTGRGAEKDLEKSFYWYIKAAQQGHVTAQLMVAIFYHSGEGAKQDTDKALVWYRRAADQGEPLAMIGIAEMYAQRKDFSTAIPWYNKAAEHGDSHAQYLLGLWYANGVEVRQDLNKANNFFAQSASQNYTPAMIMVGLHAEKNNDIPRAKEIYAKACDLGKRNLEAIEAASAKKACEHYNRLDTIDKASNHNAQQ